MAKRIQTILAIVVALSVLGGVLYKLDYRWCRVDPTFAQEAQQWYKRVDNYILQDRAHALQERMWDLEAYYSGMDMPPHVEKEYRHLQQERENVLRKLKEK